MRISRVAGALIAVAAITFAAVSPARATDFTTFGFDGGRDGWNSNETILTPANVPGITKIVDIPLGQWPYATADAQPLYLSNESTPIGVTNVVYVATEDNSILAYSPRLQAPAWQRNYNGIGTPVPTSMTGCSTETDPQLGITSTPVIDTATDTLYFVTDTVEYGQATFRLHAVSAGDGTDKFVAGGQPISVANPQYRKQRPALALANGSIYIAFGGAGCDFNRSMSWGEIFAYSATTLQMLSSYRPAPSWDGNCGNSFLDSIWASSGPAVDPSGNIWFTTGNGCLDYPTSLAQSLIRLSPTLVMPHGGANWDSQMANNAPSTNGADLDLGSGGVSISTNGAVVYGGKDGITWITGAGPNQYLGGYCYNPCLQTQAYSHQQTNGGLWGSSAIFTGPDGYQWIATGGQGSAGTTGLGVWRFQCCYRSQTDEFLIAHTGDVLSNGGTTPFVSSNGTTSGTYVVWFLKRLNGQVYLYGYNAENLQLLTVQNGGPWTRGRYPILTPAVADGYVMVASENALRIWTVAGNFARVKASTRRHK